jgi:hypothetical protein
MLASKDPPMPYFAYFQIGAAVTSLALMGIEKLHHVSVPVTVGASILGGLLLVGALKFLESR